MNEIVVEIRTTVGDATAAATLSRELVARGAAACVQVEQGLSSTYRWRGGVETAAEHRLTIKSTAPNLAATLAAIRELHPYQLPEIIWSVVEASPEYAAWVADSVGSPEREE
jgi:periplasmic divalent cation tolerance protein